MHRHGYKGRKFGRERDQRAALIKGLASSFIEHGRIETTLPKAKEIVPVIEKLITKAKNKDLASRRAIIASVSTLDIANKLVDGIAPQLIKRDSGHVRIVRTRLRVGDNTQMAVVEFVDEIKEIDKPAKPAVKKPVAAKPKAKAVKKEGKA